MVETLDVCRCCLSAEELIDIFENQEHDDYIKVLISSNYISVHQNDGLPQNMCRTCISSLSDWHKFLQKCHKSYEKLRESDLVKVNKKKDTHVKGINVDNVKIEQIFIEERPIEVGHQVDDCDYEHTTEETTEEVQAVKELQVSTPVHQENRNIKRIVVENDGKKKYNYLRQCPVCGIVVKRGLKEHIMIHSDPTGRPFKCDMCDKTYCRRENLRHHHDRVHLLIRHPCDVCGKVFSTKDILGVHRKLHNSDVVYKCDQCDRVFRSNKYLYKHKQKHKGIKKYQCTFCGKTFSVGEYLKEHLRIHTGERPFRCKVCQKVFRTANHLRQHNRIHSAIRRSNVITGHCKLEFSDKKTANNHKKEHI